MKVIRGTLVHCICPESIEVLENYVIGFNEKENGVVINIVLILIRMQALASLKSVRYIQIHKVICIAEL